VVNLIITRHVGAIEWLKSKGVTGEYLPHASGEEGQSGDSVFGPVPIDLAAKFLARGLQVYYIALPGLTLDQRKGELTSEVMDHAKASLVRVDRLELKEADPNDLS